MVLNVLMKNDFEDELDEVFGEAGVTQDQLMTAALKFFSAQKKSPTLNAARYAIFRMHKNPPL